MVNLPFQEYQTHNNGGRPYSVKVFPMIRDELIPVEIYKNNSRWDDLLETEIDEIHMLNSYQVKKVFIGRSPRNIMTLFSGGFGPEFDGNSLLLKIDEYRYIFIGDKIFSFNTDFPIVEYTSPVGNSDVPYPYAKDENGNYYLMIEDVIIKHSPTLEREIEEGDFDDIYSYYYSQQLITSDCGYNPPQPSPNPYFDEIKEWYIGNDRYTFRYTPKPEEEYLRLIRLDEEEDGRMFVVKRNGEREELSRNNYIDLMRRFGERYGFEKMKEIIQID